MRTGDMARIDPDNTLHIVDRAKDIVKSGGEWISSQHLEEAAVSHPALREAAVIPVPHALWQERPLLVLVREPGSELTADAVRDHLRRLVPKWWLPESIVFVAELPHGPTGKLDKQMLRTWMAEGKLPAAH
jgi:fatty-acyl-CoA synthase